MSNFLIMDKRLIETKNWDRAQEIVDTWVNREEADFSDLVAMIAEALQLPIEYPPREVDDGPDVEIVV